MTMHAEREKLGPEIYCFIAEQNANKFAEKKSSYLLSTSYAQRLRHKFHLSWQHQGEGSQTAKMSFVQKQNHSECC